MPENSAALRVLIVDDEPLIRWSMSETLLNAGCVVSEAPDGRHALERLSIAPAPDVILLDYRLPDSNDLGLLQRIRVAAPRASVIMMTAFGTPDVISTALSLGAFRVVSKPLEMYDLAALVQQAHAAHH